MKDLAKAFLNEKERAEINTAVQEAEKQTSGEIVCKIVSASYHYPMANVIGATAMALPLAILATPLIGSWLWYGNQSMWLFIGLFTVLFIAFYLIVDRWVWLKRRFITRKEINEEVEEAAMTSFFGHGLYRTRDATGVLMYISVFEHKVWVLADHGINAKVPEGQWDAIVNRMTDGIRRHQPAAAICQGISAVGDILKVHFPVKPDDVDELENLIVTE